VSTEPIRIKRYPNRRFYASNTSRYVSLPEIEQMIRVGGTVEIVDSQSGEDLTRQVLVQLIAEQHPEKIDLFPSAMLHAILRADDVMSGFLREYFRHSLAFVDELQKQAASGSFARPFDWMKAWSNIWPGPPIAKGAPKRDEGEKEGKNREFAERIEHLEKRIAELEQKRRGRN
jgi:polyhydroxyalkanoate synthesis repressor PhaR